MFLIILDLFRLYFGCGDGVSVYNVVSDKNVWWGSCRCPVTVSCSPRREVFLFAHLQLYHFNLISGNTWVTPRHPYALSVTCTPPNIALFLYRPFFQNMWLLVMCADGCRPFRVQSAHIGVAALRRLFKCAIFRRIPFSFDLGGRLHGI